MSGEIKMSGFGDLFGSAAGAGDGVGGAFALSSGSNGESHSTAEIGLGAAKDSEESVDAKVAAAANALLSKADADGNPQSESRAFSNLASEEKKEMARSFFRDVYSVRRCGTRCDTFINICPDDCVNLLALCDWDDALAKKLLLSGSLSASPISQFGHALESVFPEVPWYESYPYFLKDQLETSRLLKRVLIKRNKLSHSDIRFFLRLVLPTVGFNATVPSSKDGGYWWHHVFQGFHLDRDMKSGPRPDIYVPPVVDHFRMHLRVCCKSTHTALDWLVASAFLCSQETPKSTRAAAADDDVYDDDSCPSNLRDEFFRKKISTTGEIGKVYAWEWDSSHILEFMGEHAASTGAQMCGYSFNPGDIVWSCRDCQADDTCVMCEKCFSNSNHDGHDTCFNFIRFDLPPGSGGCCDCGDPEAWDAHTFCPEHMTSANCDPLEGVPQKSVVEHVSFVIECIMELVMKEFKRFYSWKASGKNPYLNQEEFPHFVFGGNTSQSYNGASKLRFATFCNELLWKVVVCWFRKLCQRLPVVRPIVARAMKKTGFLEELVTNTQRCAMDDLTIKKGLMSVLRSIPRGDSMLLIHHDLLMQLLALFEFKDTFSCQYVKSYPRVFLDLLRGNTTRDASIFTFSVQFMNRVSHVRELVDRHRYFERMLGCVQRCLDWDGRKVPIRCASRLQSSGVDPAPNEEHRSVNGELFWWPPDLKEEVGIVSKQKHYELPLSDMRYALNNNGMPQRFCKRSSLFPKSLSNDASVCKDYPTYDGFWTSRGPTPPGPMAAWLRILTSSHNLDRQRRKKGDHILVPSKTWIPAFNFSIFTSITSQQVLRHFAGGTAKPLISHGKYATPDFQEMSHLISRIFTASTGHIRQDRLPVTVDMLRDGCLPAESTCFKQALRRCGMSHGTWLLMARYSNSSLGYFENVQTYCNDASNLSKEFASIRDSLDGASFHHPLQRFAGVAFVEMAMALPEPGALSKVLRQGLKEAVETQSRIKCDEKGFVWGESQVGPFGHQHHYGKMHRIKPKWHAIGAYHHASRKDQKRALEINLLGMLTPPLRSLAFAAAIKAGMWRRNGQEEMDQQVYNYEGHLSVYLRDPDFRTVQMCAMLLDPAQFIFYCLDQFECLAYLQSGSTSTMPSALNLASKAAVSPSEKTPVLSSTFSSDFLVGDTARRRSHVTGKVEWQTEIVGPADNNVLRVLQSRLTLQNGYDEEYVPKLMDEFLLMMIRLVTEVIPPSEPAPMEDNVAQNASEARSNQLENEFQGNDNELQIHGSRSNEAWKQEESFLHAHSKRNLFVRRRFLHKCLRREIMQKLAVGPASPRDIENSTRIIGYTHPNENSMLRQVIFDVLKEVGVPANASRHEERKDMEDEGNALYVLKDTLEEHFDPTFWHASIADRQKAAGEIAKKRKRKRASNGGNVQSFEVKIKHKDGRAIDAVPFAGVMPEASPDAAGIRMLLFHPLLIEIMRYVMAHHHMQTPNRCSESLLIRVLHLLTLAAHILTHDDGVDSIDGICAQEGESRQLRNLREASDRCQRMSIKTKNPYLSCQEFFDKMTAHLPNISAGVSGQGDDELSEEGISGDKQSINREPKTTSILGVFYHEVTSGSLATMPVESAGVWWLLGCLSRMSSRCKDHLHEIGASIEGAAAVAQAEANRRKRAQDQAIEAMAAQQAKFAAMMAAEYNSGSSAESSSDDSSGEDDEAYDAIMSSAESENSDNVVMENAASTTCEDLKPTKAATTGKSNHSPNAATSQDHGLKQPGYGDGASNATSSLQKKQESSVQCVLCQNYTGHNTSELGSRSKLNNDEPNPISSETRFNGSESMENNTDESSGHYKGCLCMIGFLSGMFNVQDQTGESLTLFKQDDDETTWQGQCKGASLRLCGHAFHEECYIKYRQMTRDRDLPSRSNSYDVRTEFLCPLCKSISNVALPVNTERFHIVEHLLPHDTQDPTTKNLHDAETIDESSLPSFNEAVYDDLLQKFDITGDSLPDFVHTSEHFDWSSDKPANSFAKTQLISKLSQEECLAMRINMTAVQPLEEIPYLQEEMTRASSSFRNNAILIHGITDNEWTFDRHNQSTGFLGVSTTSPRSLITKKGGISALVFRLKASRLSSYGVNNSEIDISKAVHMESVMHARALQLACNPFCDDDRAYAPSISVTPQCLEVDLFKRHPFLAEFCHFGYRYNCLSHFLQNLGAVALVKWDKLLSYQYNPRAPYGLTGVDSERVRCAATCKSSRLGSLISSLSPHLGEGRCTISNGSSIWSSPFHPHLRISLLKAFFPRLPKASHQLSKILFHYGKLSVKSPMPLAERIMEVPLLVRMIKSTTAAMSLNIQFKRGSLSLGCCVSDYSAASDTDRSNTVFKFRCTSIQGFASTLATHR